jgi:hypothetical protein
MSIGLLGHDEVGSGFQSVTPQRALLQSLRGLTFGELSHKWSYEIHNEKKIYIHKVLL